MASQRPRWFGLALVAVVFALLGTGFWTLRGPGPAQRVTSAEGGFSLAVPTRWSVEHRHPTDGIHMEFLVGQDETLGVLHRGGFWVSRWSVPRDTDATDLRTRLRAEDAGRRHNRVIGTITIDGRPAVTLRYDEVRNRFAKAAVGTKQVVIREFVVDGLLYQVGTWAYGHPGTDDVRAALAEVAASFRLEPPRQWTKDLPAIDAGLALPGGWVEQPTDLPGALVFAVSPGDPNDAWAYVFHYGGAPDKTVAAARTNIPGAGGSIVSEQPTTFAGRPATRMEYTFPDERSAGAHGVEWVFGDGHGKTVVLAVAWRAGDASIADEIARGWRV